MLVPGGIAVSRRQVEMWITARGAVTSVGLTAASSCAAMRAGISGRSEIGDSRVEGEEFADQPVVGGRVPLEWLEGEPQPRLWEGHERFGVDEPPQLESFIEAGPARLARLIPAALDDLRRDPHWDQALLPELSVHLGLDDLEDATAAANNVLRTLGRDDVKVTTHRAGRAAGLAALAAAREDLTTGAAKAVLVGGVDSQIRPETLMRQSAARALPTAWSGGVIPGEAAAFVVVEAAEAARRRGLVDGFRLRAAVVSREPTTDTDKPSRAEGLTSALRSALRAAGEVAMPPLVICDLNGDRYRAVEWAMAWPRVLRFQNADLVFWHPADCIGDSGAASGLVNLVWGLEAMARNYARHREILVWGASDTGLRAAAVIDRPDGGR